MNMRSTIGAIVRMLERAIIFNILLANRNGSMSKIINYKCDLCGMQKPFESVVGIYFTTNTIQPKNASQCDKHLCRDCVKALPAALTKCFPEDED